MTAFPAAQPGVAPLGIAVPAAQHRRVFLSPPHLAGGELDALQAMLDSGWVAPAGPVPIAFEQAIARAIGIPHVAAVTSGTAALHLGFQLLGVCPGDEVWTSALTFVASIGPAVQMGATPRFLDVTPDTWTMDVDLLRRELASAARRGRLPRVVVPVDLYGQPADMPAIVEACAHWGVPVLSDSAASLGAIQHGRHAGADACKDVSGIEGVAEDVAEPHHREDGHHSEGHQQIVEHHRHHQRDDHAKNDQRIDEGPRITEPRVACHVDPGHDMPTQKGNQKAQKNTTQVILSGSKITSEY
jgi:hypothetical protein